MKNIKKMKAPDASVVSLSVALAITFLMLSIFVFKPLLMAALAITAIAGYFVGAATSGWAPYGEHGIFAPSGTPLISWVMLITMLFVSLSSAAFPYVNDIAFYNAIIDYDRASFPAEIGEEGCVTPERASLYFEATPPGLCYKPPDYSQIRRAQSFFVKRWSPTRLSAERGERIYKVYAPRCYVGREAFFSVKYTLRPCHNLHDYFSTGCRTFEVESLK